MKTHTTNYYNTFIEVAEGCPAQSGEVPPAKEDEKTIANIQYEMISEHPYKYTSDEILFHCYAAKKGLKAKELKAGLNAFFSKGQACLRASSLTKRYGWGVHNNEEGKVAIYGAGTLEYKKYVADKTLKIVKAMRSKKA